MDELLLIFCLCWLYGSIMSFTLLSGKKVGWWLFSAYIPWFITGIIMILRKFALDV